MQVAGIISEYNPFHNGHKYQLELVREKLGRDTLVIACMSGNFVQRGEAALLDKHLRAELAMRQGVNLVLELPTLFACASADYFAEAAVRTLMACGLNMTLCFGAEHAELDLQALAEQLSALSETEDFAQDLKAELAAGRSYAAAQAAVSARYCQAAGIELPENFFLGSNNSLAMAYLKSLLSYDSQTAHKQILAEGFRRPRIAAFAHHRAGATHLSEDLSAGDSMASASAIRQALIAADGRASTIAKNLAGKLPSTSLAALMEQLPKTSLQLRERLALYIILRLRTASAEELCRYNLWNMDLAGRVKKLLVDLPQDTKDAAAYLEALIEAARSKNFTKARIRRACNSLLLGIEQDEPRTALEAAAPAYIRVLAVDKRGRYLLKQLKRYAGLPLLNKSSDLLPFLQHENTALRRVAELDLLAEDMYALGSGLACGSDFDKHILLG